MLKPDELVLLTDALKPPHGFEMDVSVTTTYSLDLQALLLVPMTFALHGTEELSSATDVITLLHAAQKYIGRTTVFCHPGGIHEPREYSALFTFLEDSIHQVKGHDEKGVFHPKMWAVRYRNDNDEVHHRLLVSSRNLTLDDARDTLLVLDESEGGNIDSAPAADFLAALIELPGVEVAQRRREAIVDLVRTLRTVMFATPAPFTDGRLLPIGIGKTPLWPFPDSADRVLAISPFLNARILERIRGGAKSALLISRAEELNRMGSRKVDDWNSYVLNSSVEGDELADPLATTVSFSGLHAKTTVLDLLDGTSITITGSANLTFAAWNNNIEFNAVLSGPTKDCGVDAVLVDGGGLMGLQNILEPFKPETEHGETEALRDLEFKIEQFHRDLALSKPHLDVLTAEEDQVNVHLNLTIPEAAPGKSQVRLLTLPKERSRSLDGNLSWKVAPENVTAFIAVQTTIGSGEHRVTRSCCLLATVAVDGQNRVKSVLNQLITNAQDELRYLALLFDTGRGTNAFDIGTVASFATGVGAEGYRPDLSSIVLFEPLMRAVIQDPKHLARIAVRVQELRELRKNSPDGSIFEEFGPMWDAIREVIAWDESTS